MKHINKINLSQGKVDHNRFNDYSRYGKQYSDKSYINTQSNDIKKNNLQNFGSHINSEKSNYKAAVYSRNVSHKYSSRTIKHKKNKKKKNFFIKFGVVIIVLIVIGIGVYKFFPIKISINGLEQTLTYDKSVSQAINQSQLSVTPGNFIAVDYSILKAGEGEEFNIKINGNKITNLDYTLSNGDIIEYNNGDDIMEECKSVDSNIIAKSKIIGVGAVHKFSGTGESGTWSKLTGTVSGKYAERTTKEPNNVTCKNVNINPGSDKVIALTFDDGPSEEYTQQILDILDRYKAKATFFVIGENLEEEWGKKLVVKEDSKGHQVCTHTYDHARAAGGVDITVMSAEKQIEEVTKGQMMISEALGKSASTVVRLPGGNLNATTVRLIAKYVSAEIGWNIDTTDWQKPGTDVISYKLSKASNGNVILCHDGGGDRSQTVEAIEDFIKKYTDRGYKFVTIDELMNYQEATDEDSNKIIDTDNDGTSSKSKSNNSYSNSYDSFSNTNQYGYNNNYYESGNNNYGAY